MTESTGRCKNAGWCLMSETCVRLPECEAAGDDRQAEYERYAYGKAGVRL